MIFASMMKFHEIKSHLQDIEQVVKNLKTELDLMRSLLYRAWLKHQDGLIIDSEVVVPSDMEFITRENENGIVLLVQDSIESNYEKISTQLQILGFRSSQRMQEKPLAINTSRVVYELMKPLIGDIPYESFYIILLNSGNRLIKTVCISEGGITGTVVDPKKIFKIALDNFTTGLILSHNHPSGNLNPSESDKKLTKKIIEAGQLLDIHVIDHIIISGDGYYSFSDDGIMG